MAYFTVTKIKNFIGNIINPSTEEKQDVIIANQISAPQKLDDQYLWEIRRLVKLLESSATVDSSNRQRVAVETIAGTTLELS